jgi:hypothetical protein
MNIIKAFILSLLIASPAFAQANNDSFYVVEDFSKGMKSHVSEFLTPEGTANDLQNVRVNTKFGQLAKRPSRLKLSQCHAAPVDSLYRYYVSDDTKHTIATSSTYLDAIDDEGACTTLYATAQT